MHAQSSLATAQATDHPQPRKPDRVMLHKSKFKQLLEYINSVFTSKLYRTAEAQQMRQA
jgi:hypothetical protein